MNRYYNQCHKFPNNRELNIHYADHHNCQEIPDLVAFKNANLFLSIFLTKSMLNQAIPKNDHQE